MSLDAGTSEDASTRTARFPAQVTQPTATPEPLQAAVSIGPAGCEGCFELVAVGLGGIPPYYFEWSDGATGHERSVCVSERLQLSVVVHDAAATRSEPYVADLQTSDAGCKLTVPTLCLNNSSFEAVPTGSDPPLEVIEWEDCTNEGYVNTPDIGSADFSPSAVVQPEPTDGNYYLGLSEGEQVSQRMCEVAQAAETRSFEVDLMRVRRSSLSASEAQQSVFLEVWGGIAADCSQRQLLWASPPLTDSWTRHCVTFISAQYMDQLTLRARSDMTSLEAGYVAVDHLLPVERCTTP